MKKLTVLALRAVFIELLHDTGPTSPATDSSAVPRSGLKQLLDDDRVTVWDGVCRGRPRFASLLDDRG